MYNKFENSYDKEMLELLGKMEITKNPNYRKVIIEIPNHFGEDNLISRLVAFNYGVMIERQKERDLKKYSKLSIFQNMKAYIHSHNGCMPDTLQDLMEWAK